MSLMTKAWMLEQFGPRLDTAAMARVLGIEPGTVRNQISAGTFPVATYVDAGRRWCDYRDMADHLDKCRERAKAEAV